MTGTRTAGKFFTILAALLLVCSIAFDAHAAIPQTINYQGYLTDKATGNPVSGSVSMTFSIYNVTTAGTALWTETQGTVQVSNGIYNVVLGSVTPVNLLFNEQYYLGVQVGLDDELTPRQQLTAVGYAFRAAEADSVVTKGSLTVNGTITATGGFTGVAESRRSLVPLLNQTLGAPSYSTGTSRITSLPTGADPTAVTFDGTYIWVNNATGCSVTKINPLTGKVLTTIAVGTYPFGSAFDGTHLWVTLPAIDSTGTTVKKIDVVDNSIDATVTVGTEPRFVVFDGTSIWVSNTTSGTLSKINPSTNLVTNTVTVGTAPFGMAFDGTHVWVANRDDDTVSKVNITTNVVDGTIDVNDYPVALAFDGTHMWVVNRRSGNVSVIDIADNSIDATVTLPALSIPRWIAFDGTYMWVANRDTASISKINIYTRTITKTISTAVADSFPFGIAYDGAYMWVANNNLDTVDRYAVTTGLGHFVLDGSDGSLATVIMSPGTDDALDTGDEVCAKITLTCIDVYHFTAGAYVTTEGCTTVDPNGGGKFYTECN